MRPLAKSVIFTQIHEAANYLSRPGYLFVRNSSSALSVRFQRISAIKARDAIAALMTSAQIAEAQNLARAWKPTVAGVSGAPLDRPKRITPAAVTSNPSALTISLEKRGGAFVVPVVINAAITLEFVIDSGAPDVRIPADVVSTLMRTGTLRDTDFLGEETYVLADGSKVPSKTFRIRSLKVGSKTLENVVGSVSPTQGIHLLGQSFLNRFKSWSIDNQKQALTLE